MNGARLAGTARLRFWGLDIYQARLAPSGDFGFQAGSDKKFMEAQFEATMETPSGGTEPFALTWLS